MAESASRLALPQVTICAVDTRTPGAALAGMQRSMAQIDFGDAILFTAPDRLDDVHDPRVRVLPAPGVDSVATYSAFMLQGLAPHVATSHVLITQWDGFVIHPEAWEPAFLDTDYLGAPWIWCDRDIAVGNGGFSLRSKRLLDALLDPAFVRSNPEDLAICHRNRDLLVQRHGIRFGDFALGERFSYEPRRPSQPTFGVHGFFNFGDFMDDAELAVFVRDLPDAMMRGVDARNLARNLLRLKRPQVAGQIVGRRWALGMRDWKTLRLATHWGWTRLAHAFSL
ncbi:MAG: DUF5672 family protein [Leptothrix ochracea]|uniref:DUF5672 family protein n=1 Tax=Leptothrix ochracea TaxID=735331 RepID=UPI0034E1A984